VRPTSYDPKYPPQAVRAIPNKSLGFGVTVPHTGPVLGMGASGAGARISAYGRVAPHT
jgi:hypothetical protein